MIKVLLSIFLGVVGTITSLYLSVNISLVMGEPQEFIAILLSICILSGIIITCTCLILFKINDICESWKKEIEK